MCEKGLVKKEEPLRPFFLFNPVVVVVVVVNYIQPRTTTRIIHFI